MGESEQHFRTLANGGRFSEVAIRPPPSPAKGPPAAPARAALDRTVRSCCQTSAPTSSRLNARPVATTAVQSGSYVRVRGTVVGDPVYWAPNGTGRGGDNYAGAGILVDLDGGDQALLLAESMAVPDFRGALEDVRDGRIRTQGKVIDAVTEDQRTYYGFDLADFGDPPDGGRVLVLLGQP